MNATHPLHDERLARRIVVSPSGCWIWAGWVDDHGYGRILHKRRLVRAHRLTYEMLRGPINEGLTIDHLCRVRSCVNPDHLEPVTNRENILRGCGVSAINARKEVCRRGHRDWRARNSRHRDCRECEREKEARRPRRDRAAYQRAYYLGRKSTGGVRVVRACIAPLTGGLR